jgi:hypothetical protein
VATQQIHDLYVHLVRLFYLIRRFLAANISFVQIKASEINNKYRVELNVVFILPSVASEQICPSLRID